MRMEVEIMVDGHSAEKEQEGVRLFEGGGSFCSTLSIMYT